eukprot:1156601-Pelagomonas_calceolata.AAC.7
MNVVTDKPVPIASFFPCLLVKRKVNGLRGKPVPIASLQMLQPAHSTKREQGKPKPRERLIEDLLKYAHTDVTCCRYEPGKVADRQAEVGA